MRPARRVLRMVPTNAEAEFSGAAHEKGGIPKQFQLREPKVKTFVTILAGFLNKPSVS